jgi:hypothetical protein
MRKTSLLLLALSLLGACGDPAPTGSTAAVEPQAAPSLSSAASAENQDNKDLATLRAATARFHRYDVAKEANYTFLFMNMCMEDDSPAKAGGMGYHYVNTDLLDAKLDVANPEALLYEPGSNGQLNLVAVEYVIPKAAWTSAEPPMLFGKQLKLNKFDLWALHVWVWENNPSGLYKDWNPRVSCANATN